MKQKTFISLFSGIGGLDLGLEWAGWQCVAQVEKDDYCRRVLAKHWPDVPRFEDVHDVGRHNLPTADAVVGGFPCQPHSYAGQRRGAADDRNLWPEYLRIITELAPAWVVGENVPGLRTTMLDDIISDLEGAGYAVQTFDIPAIAFDARHIRHRLFIVAYAEGERTWHERKNRHSRSGEVYALNYAGSISRGNDKQGNGETMAHTASSERNAGAEVGGEVRTLAENGGIVDNADRPSAARAECLGSAASAGLPDGAAEQMGEPGAQPQSERPSRAGEFWAVEPAVGRVAYGVPYRVQRLRGLGNAVVPQVAEFVGRMILEAENERCGR
jgi:DNA (cytosine-5)-methyltransferase 1